MKTVIIGGVAGGMSAAARLRRLDASAEILVFERGGYVSFANCGLPYHLSGVIEERDALLLQTPDSLAARFGLDVRIHHEVTAIDAANRTLAVRDLQSGEETLHTYDNLVLAPGAGPFVPDVPGADRGLTLRSVEDLDRLLEGLEANPRSAVVAGGGFIGVETAENLVARGVATTIVELAPQVLAPLDPEMVAPVHAELRRHGIRLVLGESVAAVAPTSVQLSGGDTVPADLVVFAIGVRPDTALARSAGLAIGPRGGILVDDNLRTSDPHIYAVGDAVEKLDSFDGSSVLVPLANLANRAGRRVADAIAGEAAGDAPLMTPAVSTAIVKVFDLTVAVTGWNEKRARAANHPVAVVHTHPYSHASYYPGARPMDLKLIFDPADGRILGAQAVGSEGIDKRIDVIATAIAAGLSAPALADLELAYAPPFGSAKDPVNILGYIAENRLRGVSPSVQWHELEDRLGRGAFLLDVRSREEFSAGHIPGARNIPIDELSGEIDKVPGDRPVIVYCAVGQRAHVAAALLRGHGLDVANLDGGWQTWVAGQAARQDAGAGTAAAA